MRIRRESRVGGREPASAFTLIEIMIVVAILGVVMTMGLPAIYKVFRNESLGQTVADILDVCAYARGQAILQGSEVDVVIRPKDRTISAGSGGGESGTTAGVTVVGAAPSGNRSSAHWPDRITIEGLGVNEIDWTEAEEARVRFYPNGTCDEMKIVLLSDKGERREIMLEITTSLAIVESDANRFR